MDNTARFLTIAAALVGAIMVAAGALTTTFHPGNAMGDGLERWGVVVSVVAIAIGLANEAINRRRG